MGLTFGPDPVHLLEGAGTAAEQAAFPRLYARPGGGWTTTPPRTYGSWLTVVPYDGGQWLATAVPPPASVDWGDGTVDTNVQAVTHTYAADGPYTVTAVGSDGRSHSVLIYNRADQLTGPPQLTSLTPDTVPVAGGAVLVTLDGTGFTATSKVMAQIYGLYDDDVVVEITPTFVTDLQLTMMFDVPNRVTPTMAYNVWVKNADGKATWPLILNTS